MLLILAAQLAAATAGGAAATSPDQERLIAAEVLAYAQWRNCVLKVTHHIARVHKDPGAVVDAAFQECASREATYRTSLTGLAALYKLADTDGFAQRNLDEARKDIHAQAIKELPAAGGTGSGASPPPPTRTPEAGPGRFAADG